MTSALLPTLGPVLLTVDGISARESQAVTGQAAQIDAWREDRDEGSTNNAVAEPPCLGRPSVL